MNTRKIGRPRLDGEPQNRRDGPLQVDMLALLLEHIPGTETLRWRNRAEEAFLTAPEVQGVEDDFRSALNDLAFLPDAFLIDRGQMLLHFFEVEISAPMKNAKLEAYGVFLTIMDYYGIEFAVFTVNQYGHINQIDLMPYWANHALAVAAMERQ